MRKVKKLSRLVALFLVVFCIGVVSEKTVFASKELPKTTYVKDTFFDQTTLQGIQSTSELYFYVPSYWDTKYVYVELEYDVSELIYNVTSSMTFYINDEPLRSFPIQYEVGKKQACYLQIPLELVKEGYNKVSISVYAKLYEEEGCSDDYSNANWFSISENSYIRCGYEALDYGRKLSYYPYPFMSTMDENGKGLSIAVSDKATNGEVAAAMNLMADLSTETGKTNAIQMCLYSDLAGTKPSRTILVSLYEELPDNYKGLVKKDTDLSNEAAVFYSEDGNKNPVLVITSNNEQCLLEAAYMLMDEARIEQEKKDYTTVPLGSSELMKQVAKNQTKDGVYTLEEILGGGLSFTGPFHQEQTVYLPFSSGYILSEAGNVTLNFRYSENLDFRRSLITVFWGDTPIASKKLEKENASGDVLSFSIPKDVLGTSAGGIKIVFDLELPDMLCTPRQGEMPWAYVAEDSILKLPTTDTAILNFDAKPSPFVLNGMFHDVMLVLSDTPTTIELNLFGQLIGMYGNGVNPYGTFYVRRTSEFSEQDADYNVMTLGNYELNSLIASLNDSLYFSYEKGTNVFASNEKLVLSKDYAREIATLQLLEFPYAKNRALLVAAGSSKDSMYRLGAYLRDYSKRSSLTKDCVIIDQNMTTKAYTFNTHLAGGEKPGVIGSLARNKQSLVFTIVATSMMGMLLIAVVIILLRIRMYHKTKEQMDDDSRSN